MPDDITCRELVELVTDYLENGLPVDDRTRFELHIAYCEGCKSYLQQMRAIIRTAGRLTEEAIPPRVRDELLTVFREWKKR
jgi:anti-sigma factor RsiW